MRVDQARTGLVMVDEKGRIGEDTWYSPVVHDRHADRQYIPPNNQALRIEI